MLLIIAVVAMILTGAAAALYANHLVAKMASVKEPTMQYSSIKVNVEKPARTMEDTNRRMTRISEMRT